MLPPGLEPHPLLLSVVRLALASRDPLPDTFGRPCLPLTTSPHPPSRLGVDVTAASAAEAALLIGLVRRAAICSAIVIRLFPRSDGRMCYLGRTPSGQAFLLRTARSPDPGSFPPAWSKKKAARHLLPTRFEPRRSTSQGSLGLPCRGSARLKLFDMRSDVDADSGFGA